MKDPHHLMDNYLTSFFRVFKHLINEENKAKIPEQITERDYSHAMINFTWILIIYSST